MKWLGSFLVASFVLLASATSVSANSDIQNHNHDEVEPQVIISCMSSASGWHEMVGAGAGIANQVLIFNPNTGERLFQNDNFQLWQCRACGHHLASQYPSWSSGLGRYITEPDMKLIGYVGQTPKIFHTTKKFSDLKYDDNKKVEGYYFY